MQEPKVIVIVGPTASGKTALSVELARRFSGEIISADSRQIYKGLDIGSGKVTKREMKGIPHHLLDVASPKRAFTAAQYVKKARKACAEIISRGHVPIICGGTGFYIDAFLGKIVLPEVPPNSALRKKYMTATAAQMYFALLQKDPVRAATIDKHNPRRLIRALEIADALGSSPLPSSQKRYDALVIGLLWDQEKLDARISKRLQERLKAGMIAEGRRLHAAGLSYSRMEELGLEYRGMARFLRGSITREQLNEALFTDIRRYSRKQMIYWDRDKTIRWFPATNAAQIERECEAFLGVPTQAQGLRKK